MMIREKDKKLHAKLWPQVRTTKERFKAPSDEEQVRRVLEWVRENGEKAKKLAGKVKDSDLGGYVTYYDKKLNGDGEEGTDKKDPAAKKGPPPPDDAAAAEALGLEGSGEDGGGDDDIGFEVNQGGDGGSDDIEWDEVADDGDGTDVLAAAEDAPSAKKKPAKKPPAKPVASGGYSPYCGIVDPAKLRMTVVKRLTTMGPVYRRAVLYFRQTLKIHADLKDPEAAIVKVYDAVAEEYLQKYPHPEAFGDAIERAFKLVSEELLRPTRSSAKSGKSASSSGTKVAGGSSKGGAAAKPAPAKPKPAATVEASAAAKAGGSNGEATADAQPPAPQPQPEPAAADAPADDDTATVAEGSGDAIDIQVTAEGGSGDGSDLELAELSDDKKTT